ncbi:MAG: hypothetical protein JXB45_09225, partial [Candidatus Krumholzibacteriota bacterium]|nr:hypothetical protein [Candidatus Krumholzibacteriota bacterium]
HDKSHRYDGGDANSVTEQPLDQGIRQIFHYPSLRVSFRSIGGPELLAPGSPQPVSADKSIGRRFCE